VNILHIIPSCVFDRSLDISRLGHYSCPTCSRQSTLDIFQTHRCNSSRKASVPYSNDIWIPCFFSAVALSFFRCL